MKKSLLLTALMVGSASAAMAAVATVNLSNLAPVDGNGIPTGPIYYLAPGTQAPSDVFVEIWGGSSASTLEKLNATAITASFLDTTGDGNGDMYLFEGGVGEFSAAVVAGSDVTMKVRSWTGAATYDAATFKGETGTWTVKSGSWDKTPPIPLAPDIALNMPALTMIDTSTVIPEPTTIALAMLGGAALFLRRRQ